MFDPLTRSLASLEKLARTKKALLPEPPVVPPSPKPPVRPPDFPCSTLPVTPVSDLASVLKEASKKRRPTGTK